MLNCILLQVGKEFERFEVKQFFRHVLQPMFLFMSFQAPHSPLQAPQQYIDVYDDVTIENRKVYSAMVSALDDAVGEIVISLKKNGLYDNTVIVFSSGKLKAQMLKYLLRYCHFTLALS